MTKKNDLATVKNYYNAISQLYDENSSQKRWPVNTYVAESLQTVPHKTNTLLDLGAGTGLTIETAMQASPVKNIVAVDIADNMLTILKKKYASSITFVESSLEKFLEEDRRRFDLITAIGVLDFPAELPKIISQLGSHLNKGGLAMGNYILPQQPGQTRHTYPSRAVPGTLLPAYCWQPQQINDAISQWGDIIIDKDIPGHIPQPGARRMKFRFFVARKRAR